MRNIWTIAKRELHLLFIGPIAYITMIVFLLTLGIFFYIELSYAIQTQQYIPTMGTSFQLIAFPLLFLAIPAITMRSIAEEKRTGTLEFLLTAPVRDWELITGKWLGGFLFFLITLAVTLVYPLVLSLIIKPGIDLGAILAGYIGLILLASAMTAIGIAMSSLFNNQIASLFATLGVIIVFWIISSPAQYMEGIGGDILRNLSLTTHLYDTFLAGILDLKDMLYYISFTVFALFIGKTAVEIRRWG
ncbi:MAG: ABC transporter permease subunit [Anaerolineaceae bacterium]|nr:ABC transporter permease subunit [Anaerolineaceae bacterium]